MELRSQTFLHLVNFIGVGGSSVAAIRENGGDLLTLGQVTAEISRLLFRTR